MCLWLVSEIPRRNEEITDFILLFVGFCAENGSFYSAKKATDNCPLLATIPATRLCPDQCLVMASSAGLISIGYGENLFLSKHNE